MIFYFCFNKFKLNSDLHLGAIVLDTADIEQFLLLKNNNNNNSVPWDTTGHTESWTPHESIGDNSGLDQCCLMEHHDPALLLPYVPDQGLLSSLWHRYIADILFFSY